MTVFSRLQSARQLVILLQGQSVTSCLQYMHLLYYEPRLLHKGNLLCSCVCAPKIMRTPLTPPAGCTICFCLTLPESVSNCCERDCEKIFVMGLFCHKQQVIILKWTENEYDLFRQA